MLIIEVTLYDESQDEATPTVASLGVPEKAEEITLRQYVDYIEIWNNLPLFVKEKNKEDWDEQEHIDYMNIRIKALAIMLQSKADDGNFYPCDDEQLLSIPIDEDEEDSMFALLSTIDNAIKNYKPKIVSEFEHKGIKFKVPDNMKLENRILKHGTSMRVIEAAEALQLEHVYSATDKEGNYKIDDRRYKTDLGVMACVCRKVEGGKVEKMPLDWQKRRDFISKRIKFFHDIPMTVALDVAFFLTDSNMTSNILKALDTFIAQAEGLQSNRSWTKYPVIKNGVFTGGITSSFR